MNQLNTWYLRNVRPDLYCQFQSAQKIFGGEVKNHILLFMDKGEGFDEKVEIFKSVAKDFKGKVRSYY